MSSPSGESRESNNHFRLCGSGGDFRFEWISVTILRGTATTSEPSAQLLEVYLPLGRAH